MENPKKRKRTGAERDRRKAEILEAKRKEGEEENGFAEGVTSSASAAASEDDALAQRVASRIPPGIKHLRGVFKQAKKWETGRLVKKIKGMRGKAEKENELKDLEAQLALLSHIRVTPLVTLHLQSKISKLSQYRKSPTLPLSITSALTLPNAASTAEPSAQPMVRSKVENRLLSAKGVGLAVAKVVEWLVSEEGTKLSQAPGASKDGGKRKRTGSSSSLDDSIPLERGNGVKEIAGEVLSDFEEDLLDDFENNEDDEEEEEVDEAGWESGSIDEDGDHSAVDIPSDEDEEDTDDDDDEDEDAETPPAPKAQKAKTQTSAKDLSSSLFLPSLATGFTRGNDSDSDPDLDVDDTGTIGKVRKGAERKNRRGQRARQAIWEKKFGKHAKHVAQHRKEEAEEAAKKAERAEKRAAKYEARYPSSAAPSRNFKTNHSSAPAASAPPTAAATAPAKHVHPSWEAAKLRKQQESAAANAPKATKIVFD